MPKKAKNDQSSIDLTNTTTESSPNTAIPDTFEESGFENELPNDPLGLENSFSGSEFHPEILAADVENELQNSSFSFENTLLSSVFQSEVSTPDVENALQNYQSELPKEFLPETESPPKDSTTFDQPEIYFEGQTEIQLEPIHYQSTIEHVKIFKDGRDDSQMRLCDMHDIFLDRMKLQPTAKLFNDFSEYERNRFHDVNHLNHYFRKQWHVFYHELIDLNAEQAAKKFFHYYMKKCDYYDYLRDLNNLPLRTIHRLFIVTKQGLLCSVYLRIWEMKKKEGVNAFLNNWYTDMDELCGYSEEVAEATISFYDLSLNQIKNIKENIRLYSLKDIRNLCEKHTLEVLSQRFHFKNEQQFDLYLKRRWRVSYDQMNDTSKLELSQKEKRTSYYYNNSRYNLALRPPYCKKLIQDVEESLDNTNENNLGSQNVSSEDYVQSVLTTLQEPVNKQNTLEYESVADRFKSLTEGMNKKQKVDHITPESRPATPLGPPFQVPSRNPSRSANSSSFRNFYHNASCNFRLNNNNNNNNLTSNASLTSQKSTDPLGVEALAQNVLQNAKKQP